MNVKELLPIGSIVLLEEGRKKLMVCGIKQTDNATEIEYDYIGVLYPEGSMGEGSQYLFNHENIIEVFHKGYEDAERKAFLDRVALFYVDK